MIALLCFSITLTSCQEDQPNTDSSNSSSGEIKKDSLNKILGTWMDEERRIYTIESKDNEVLFNRDSFNVIKADEDNVVLQNSEELKSSYTFKTEKDKTFLLESHQVSKGARGGDLAPKKVKQIFFKELERNNNKSNKEFQDGLKKMMSLYEEKHPFSFQLTEHTIEGDPIVTQIGFNELELSVIQDTTADKYGAQEKVVGHYQNMILKDKILKISEPVDDQIEKEVIIETE